MILVAEEDEGRRQQLARAVEEAGFEACATARGAECMYWAEIHHVALVLLDVPLADGNGLDTLKALRARHPDIPVVLFTEQRSSTAEMLGVAMGACAYVAGPVDDCQVSALVRRYVKREPSAAAVRLAQGTGPFHGRGADMARPE